MAATLDDLVYLATAQRVDLRFALDRVEQLLTTIAGGPAAGGGGAAPAPAPAAAPGSGLMAGLTNGPARILAMFGALEKAITSFGGQVARFVSQASPAHMLKWNMAIADLQAVIGRALLPVMERLTQMVRKLADAFVNLSPEAQKLAVGLGVGSGLGAAIAGVAAAAKLLMATFGRVPVLIGTLVASFVGVMTTMDSGRSLMKAFNGLLRATITLFESLARVLVPLLDYGLTPVLDALAGAIQDVSAAVESLVDAARSLFGLEPVSRTDRSSVGAAVRGAQIGDVQGFINRAYTSAFQGGVNSIEAQQLEELKGLRRDIRERGIVPGTDTFGSARRPLAAVDRAVGGDGSIGRGLGAALDLSLGPLTAPVRGVVSGLRSLFG